jgi:hypothetical protein
LAFLLCACVTSAPLQGPAQLRGCWIARDGENVRMLQWSQRESASWWGEEVFIHDGDDPEHQGFRIDRMRADENENWEYCPIDEGLGHGPPCQALFFGRRGAQNEGRGEGTGERGDTGDEWTEIYVDPQHLRIVQVESSERRTFFEGVRDNCSVESPVPGS